MASTTTFRLAKLLRFIVLWLWTWTVPLVLCAVINFPAYPPQQWDMRVSFTFSQDVLKSFLEEKPEKDKYLSSGMLSVSFGSDNGAIRGPSTHAVLTHKNRDVVGIENETLGYIPLIEQAGIYSNSCRVFESFRFTKWNAHPGYAASGIDVWVDLTINGRSISVRYDKLQAAEPLPEGLAPLFALLRRNLPDSYRGLFFYFRVADLPPLTGEVAKQYRRCQVHNEWMKVGDLGITYGLVIPDDENVEKAYEKATKKLFPNVNLSSMGGCVTTPNSPRSEKVLFCQSCREARKKWLKENDKAH